MRNAVLLLLAMCLCVVAQYPAYLHDPVLDTINNNIAQLSLPSDDINNLPRRIADTNLSDANLIRSNIVNNTTIYGKQYRAITNVSSTDGGVLRSNETLMAFRLTNYVAGLGSNFTVPGFYGLGSNNAYDAQDYLGDGEGNNTDIAIENNAIGFHGHLMPTMPNWLSHTDGSLDWLPAAIRMVICAVCWLIFAVSAMDYLQKRLSDVISQRQTAGSTESVLGTNASVVVGLAYAAATTIAVGTLIGVISTLPFFTKVAGQTTQVTDLFDSVANSIPFWYQISVWLPIFGMFTIWLYYVVFTRILLWPLHMAVRALILWLIR